MVLKKLTKIELAFLAGIILIIPFIIVFQLANQPDINISDLTFPINDRDQFENQCFFGQTECVYTEDSRKLGEIQFRETQNNWQIIGTDVWCIKTERTVAVPVSDPVGVITQETEVSCNNIAIFDKNEWDLAIFHADTIDGFFNTFTFTMKGT